MRAIALAAMICGFGAGLVTFPILVAHLGWPGILVTLFGVTACILGAFTMAWLIAKSVLTKPGLVLFG